MSNIVVVNNVSLDGVMGLAGTRAILLGRRRLRRLLAEAGGDKPFTAVLKQARKYVASTTLAPQQPWANTTVLGKNPFPRVSGDFYDAFFFKLLEVNLHKISKQEPWPCGHRL